MTETKNSRFNLSEETISMFLGLMIVVVVVGLVFNFIQRKRGSVDVPGINSQMQLENENEVVENGNGESKGKYVVTKGDSLWKIAQAAYGDGYKWSEIAKENNLSNPGLLAVGQELKMPQIEKSQEETVTIAPGKGTIETGSEYTVVRGDSLWKIAVAAYGDGYKWTRLWDENKIKLYDPNKLEIGMRLTLPKE